MCRSMDIYKSDAFGTDTKKKDEVWHSLEGQKAVQKHTCTPRSSVAGVGDVKVWEGSYCEALERKQPMHISWKRVACERGCVGSG